MTQNSTRLEKRMVLLLGANVMLALTVLVLYGLFATGDGAGSRVINIAGRQRMLSQRLVGAALFEAQQMAETVAPGQPANHLGLVAEIVPEFERALHGLIDGDAELGLPPCATDTAAEQLRTVGAAWGSLRALMEKSSEPFDVNEVLAYGLALRSQSDLVLAEMEEAVRLLEEYYQGQAKTLSTLLGLSIAATAVISLLLAYVLRNVMVRRKRQDARLAASEARIRAIVDSAADGIITIDENGIVESFNAAAREIFGYSGDEVIGNSVNMLMPSPYREEHDGYLLKYLATGVKRIVGMRREVAGRRKDGSTFPMDLHVSELRLSERRSFTGIVRDITKRKQAEEEIARQNRFLNTVLESLPYPFSVIDTEDYSILMANSAAQRDAPVGAKACHAMTHHRDTPCAGSEHPCPLVEVKRTGKPSMVEHTHTHADGSPMPVEVHAFPVFDKDGRVVQLIEYSLDITERKRAEEVLQENERYLQTLLDGIRAGILVIDAETHEIVDANACALEMLGAPKESVVGKICHKYICPAERGRCPVTDLGQTVDFAERKLVRADGGSVPVLKSVVTVERRGRTYLLESFVDLTELKQAEAELAALNEQLLEASRQAGMAEIATGVLHNVGNVLNSVNVSAALVSDKLRKSKISGLAKASDLMSAHTRDLAAFMTEDEKGKKLPDYLAKLAEHLVDEQTSILGELDELSKNVEHIKKIVSTQQSHAGAFGVVESVSIAHVVEDALTVNATSFERYGIKLERDYADLPPMSIDKQKLLQIMVNLVRNAKHAVLDTNQKDKRLTVRVAGDEESPIRIEVIDNGVGIAEENLTRIFSHGFTTKSDGHGFGLHSSALATKDLGASLTAHSDGPGKGATFTLELPLKPVEVTK